MFILLMCLIYFLYSLLSFLLVSKFASYLLDWYWLPRTRQATMSLAQLRGHGKLMAVRLAPMAVRLAQTWII